MTFSFFLFSYKSATEIHDIDINQEQPNITLLSSGSILWRVYTSANKYSKNNVKRLVVSAQPVVKYVIGCQIHKEQDLNIKFISFN
jgi:hypothetical protein